MIPMILMIIIMSNYNDIYDIQMNRNYNMILYSIYFFLISYLYLYKNFK